MDYQRNYNQAIDGHGFAIAESASAMEKQENSLKDEVPYVVYSISDARLYCGVDAIINFSIIYTTPGSDHPGDPDEYNRRKRVMVPKENWLDSIEQHLIGKPGLLVFARRRRYDLRLDKEFDNSELLKMVEADPRCTLMASYLNRTGPHAYHPNHLRLYMFLGKHENPELE